MPETPVLDPGNAGQISLHRIYAPDLSKAVYNLREIAPLRVPKQTR